MIALIRPFIDLLFFRGKVEDIPASSTLLGMAAFTCVLTDFISSVQNAPISTAFIIAAAQVLLMAGFLKLLLTIHRKRERWLQALTALLGSLSLLNLLSTPFSHSIDTEAEGTLVLTPGLIIVGLLQLWFFVVMARVLRETLEVRMGRAVILSFLLSYGIALVIITVFGGLLMPEAITAQ